jgi:hypothetical protein
MGFDLADFQRDTGLPLRPSGEVDLIQFGRQVVLPWERLGIGLQALMRLIETKWPQRSRWHYVGAASMGIEVGGGVAGGGQAFDLVLQRRAVDGAQRIRLRAAMAQIGFGLGISLKVRWQIFARLAETILGETIVGEGSSTGRLCLSPGQRDFESADFVGPTCGIALAVGAATSTSLSVVFFDIDDTLRATFGAFARCLDGLRRAATACQSLAGAVVPGYALWKLAQELGATLRMVEEVSHALVVSPPRGALVHTGLQPFAGASLGVCALLGSVPQVEPAPLPFGA